MDIRGKEPTTIYRLHFHGGGILDGSVETAYQPYHVITNGHRYEAKEEPPNHLHYVDDWTYDIHLYFVGVDKAPVPILGWE